VKASPIAKLTHPAVLRVFPRERLFALLDRKRQRPVIWVVGPPGSGKTTLLTSYLEARKVPCLWYQLDKADADPATFFYYLGQAAKRASPRKRKPLPHLTREYLQGIPTFSIHYFENLFERLMIPSIMVFDNYQEVPAESTFHEIILNGLYRIPQGVNIILISRSTLPPPFMTLRANGVMESIGWNELRLTLKESAGIIRLREKNGRTKDRVLHLHDTADGWVAGLVLMLESAKESGTGAGPLEMLAPEEVFAYFASEVFNKTQKDVQTFLLKTAFLPKMTAKMAEEITGFSHSHRILSGLTQSHYFTVKSYQMESRYEYHPLFREFLLSRAKESLPPAHLSDLLRRGASILEENGQAEAAVSLLHDVGDWQGMVRICLKHASSMLEQGRFRPLEEWLSRLPKDILERNPRLLYWSGACRLPFHPSLSQSYFEKAFEGFRAQGDAAGIFSALSGIVEAVITGYEDFRPLDRWIGVLEEMMRRCREFPSDETEIQAAHAMFMALAFRQPQHPEIERWTGRAFALAERTSSLRLKIQTFYRLAVYRLAMGDMGKAWSAIQSLRQLTRSRDVSPYVKIEVKQVEAGYYRMEGSHESCLKAVSEALEISRNMGVHRLDQLLLSLGAQSALGVNDGATAAKLLERKDSSTGPLRSWDICMYHFPRTRESLFRGDLGQASLHAERALKFSRIVGSPISTVQCHLLRAQVMHPLGKNREATYHLGQTFSLARRMGSKISEFYGLLTEALFALDQGKEQSALASLKKGLSMGKAEGYFTTLLDWPSATARLCSKALEAGIETAYVQDLIRKLHIVPEEAPLHLENWPWSLKIYTLGQFDLLKDGKSIRFSRKLLTMLKALISFGGKGIREEQITDILWPEADGDVAHQSFEITLHRLRQLIGVHEALQLHEGRITLDPRYCWVDAWAFEGYVDGADASWGKGPRGKGESKAIQQTQKAIILYQGAFLPGDASEPWTHSLRERLRSKFLRCVVKLGRHWQETKEWEKAAECYQRGLEVDERIEEFYLTLMLMYQRLGKRTEALSVYDRCRRALSSTLGVEPSPETEAIRNTLLAGKKS
jgi:ATP/maltotriose-dependent transcriptional regulator MalT/DNA-binding SARP family transcriptional activator